MTNTQGALAPYRVLDLTEGGCNLGPRLLGDLGADVLRVERPEGSPTRRLDPFYRDKPHPKESLFWWAYNYNKRGITLDLKSDGGRGLLNALVHRADFLFESFPPGYLDSLGLGYRALREINPALIMASITPFGQTGPCADYQGPDLVVWALGGYLWLSGDPDRPPVRVSLPPQAFFHASAMAAAASLMALQHRARTGHGQHVDQSAQQAVAWMLPRAEQYYQYMGDIPMREGGERQFGSAHIRVVHPCRDGFVVHMLVGGMVGAQSNGRLAAWIEREGMAPDWLKAIDWSTFDATYATQEELDRFMGVLSSFFRTKTKAELLDAAVPEQLPVVPIATLADLLENPQLQARRFWVAPPAGAPDAALRYPGAPFIMSETPWRIYRRAPRAGEHNWDVYHGELGLSPQRIEKLRVAGAI